MTSSEEIRSPLLLRWAVKVVLVVGLVSVGATHYMARSAASRAGAFDPEVTGSIVGRAALDPCALPKSGSPGLR
ncbi:hypothetical protein [Methylobacterium organophilum]|uniref:Uncharacterized protein n=1 Tax=Methylobacterium organophilum TaxID=410 RepID=A0ABQ4T9G4_METOR|nr:hypothetical protein [Methylobacterium organophilum]GJE27114.1 hypothetical protein LKMONMHP_1970 [Methylobacterium organophilum]